MITEDYVSFETAKLLKEKGFDGEIVLWYDEDGKMFYQHKDDINRAWRVRANQEVYECPTHQMVMKWLREVHNTDICVCRELDEYGDCFDGFIAVVYSNKVYEVTIRDVEKDLSYEEAAESAIKYCLENLI